MARAVLAEIGINHDGDMSKARRLIEAAKYAGCEGIKFQYRNVNRAYSYSANEIGDEIILTQIRRTYLDSNQILDLKNFAQSIGIRAGISFFTVEDLSDFSNLAGNFDFFKIPSAEMMNTELIHALLDTGKMVYISVGMHQESQIESIFSKLSNYRNWIPMHCISNYPVADHNASLGYIQYLKTKWKREVGYSSHDECWENNLVALSLGASVIERHITESPGDLGLDHSSSSTKEDFIKIVEYANKIDDLIKGNIPRIPNQGELLNKQNLGRSFYAKRSMKPGSIVRLQEFSYRSPQTGLGFEEASSYEGLPLVRPIEVGTVLTSNHVQTSAVKVSDENLKLARALQISLPVRLTDYHLIRESLPIGKYEFHLSYKEVNSGFTEFETESTDKFSVHLPDYIDSTTLIDPFSKNKEIQNTSHECIRRVTEFAEKLAKETSSNVPVVASFAGIGMERNSYYTKVAKLFDEYSSDQVALSLQWLPPFAWYFGGSIKLNKMCEEVDVNWIIDSDISVTLDTSHLILGKNYFEFDALGIIEKLLPNIIHWHISDAIGADGEGMQLGDGGEESKRIIAKSLSQNRMKVIEVWQGHFNNLKGFKEAINRLPTLVEEIKS